MENAVLFLQVLSLADMIIMHDLCLYGIILSVK